MKTQKQKARQENLTNYLESFFSENQIRQIYALFLSGENVRAYSQNKAAIKADYDNCFREAKAMAATLPYDDVINELTVGWDRSSNKTII